MLHASPAAASKKLVKIAHVNVATKCDPPKKGNVTDSHELNSPPNCVDNVPANPNAVTVICEDNLILDSGASNCVVPSFLLSGSNTKPICHCLPDRWNSSQLVLQGHIVDFSDRYKDQEILCGVHVGHTSCPRSKDNLMVCHSPVQSRP